MDTPRPFPQKQLSSPASQTRTSTSTMTVTNPVGIRPAVFPSPPATRANFSQQRLPQSTGGSSSSSVNNSTNNYHHNSGNQSTSTLPRSISAPTLNPGLSTYTNQQHVVHSQQQNNSLSFNQPSASKTPDRPSKPHKSLTRGAFAPVPVNMRLAVEARKAVMAKRLRVNLLLLLAWYLITDSRLYR